MAIATDAVAFLGARPGSSGRARRPCRIQGSAALSLTWRGRTRREECPVGREADRRPTNSVVGHGFRTRLVLSDHSISSPPPNEEGIDFLHLSMVLPRVVRRVGARHPLCGQVSTSLGLFREPSWSGSWPT